MQVKIKKIIDEARNVRTLRLEKPFGFIPGQYVMVKHLGDARPITISSSKDSDFIDITVKKNHAFTSGLLRLEAGDVLDIDGPFGETLNLEKAEKVGYIAGGSGITPFMSHIRSFRLDYVLLYSNRTREDIIFHEELAGNENVQLILTRENHQARITRDNFKGIDMDRIWFVCGPPAMNKAMRALLEELGAKDIRIESFELEGTS